MKLLSMTEFLLCDDVQQHEFYYSITQAYARFLKQPLALWMFLPCDDEGNVLEYPTDMYNNAQYFGSEMDAYAKAKSRILFEGFEIESEEEYGVFVQLISDNEISFCVDKEKEMPVESLLSHIDGDYIELSMTALMQIGIGVGAIYTVTFEIKNKDC